MPVNYKLSIYEPTYSVLSHIHSDNVFEADIEMFGIHYQLRCANLFMNLHENGIYIHTSISCNCLVYTVQSPKIVYHTSVCLQFDG